MNNFLCTGRLTKNPELKYTTENKPICSIDIAINNGKDDTTFLPITIFGKMAEVTNEYCKKGDLVGITGIIKNHNWEDKEGKKHYDYSFIANRVQFLSTKQKEEKPVQNKGISDEVFEEFGEQIEIDDGVAF